MHDQIRDMLLAAVRAGKNGFPPDPAIAQGIANGNRALMIDELKFDSLAWMEFCISIELQSGQELTTADIEGMQYLFEVEEWLRARV
jgi:hypothetical protein